MEADAGKVTFKVKADTKDFSQQIYATEKELQDLQKAYEKAMSQKGALEPNKEVLEKMRLEIEKTRNKLVDLNKKQLALNETTKEYGNSFSNVGKKITKMGLAIFGIRSAYMLIRQSANQLANENEEVANKLNAIKNSLTNAIAPIAIGLVNIVYKLLAYLNVITKTFLGLDLFKKSAKSSKQTLGTAQKLRKTLASFDEMNILNDNTQSAGSGGTAGGIKIEEPDVSGFQKVVDKFKEMWNEILEIDREEAKKLFLETDETWGLFKLGLFDFVQGSVEIFQGFFDTVKGLWDIIVGWATDDDKKIQNGVKELKKALTRILEGLGQILIAPWEMAQGVINGICKTIINFVKDKVINPLKSRIKDLKNEIKNTFKDSFWKTMLNGFIAIFNKVIEKINNKLTISIGSTLSKVLKALGVNVSSGKYSLFTIPKIPKLAKGGIVNMPGRGIPIGGALTGERGAEGVIPLTDSQQMELLGQAIGKYITINATIPVYAYNRQVDRQMKRIQAEDSFASNR